MSRYKRGDVVWFWCPYYDQGERFIKERPGVILEEIGDNENVIIQCTSKDRSDHLPGILVRSNSPEGKQMGIKKDTFINLSVQVTLKVIFIERKIGNCPFMDKIDDLLDGLGPD